MSNEEKISHEAAPYSATVCSDVLHLNFELSFADQNTLQLTWGWLSARSSFCRGMSLFAPFSRVEIMAENQDRCAWRTQFYEQLFRSLDPQHSVFASRLTKEGRVIKTSSRFRHTLPHVVMTFRQQLFLVHAYLTNVTSSSFSCFFRLLFLVFISDGATQV